MNSRNYNIYQFPECKGIVVSGDIHGDFNLLVNKICVQYQMQNTLVIVAGDCGFGFDQAYHVAIKRDRKVKVPSFPKIELHHYTSNILEIGVMEKVIDGFKVKVYDVERCVCDAVKFRNKVGIDVCSEIIDNYLSRPGRNISKLMDYARQLRVGNILENYLQVKL